MATQSPSDTPFGLDPNVAAGLAYLFGILGGIVMLAGGGANRFVKWAACQSITLGGVYIVAWIAINILIHLGPLVLLALPLSMIVFIAYIVAWLWTFITAFQGREVRVPFIADLTEKIFASQLA